MPTCLSTYHMLTAALAGRLPDIWAKPTGCGIVAPPTAVVASPRWLLGHHNVIYESAPVHATLAQPAAGADALKEKIRARARVDARVGLKIFPGARARVLGEKSTNPAEFCIQWLLAALGGWRCQARMHAAIRADCQPFPTADGHHVLVWTRYGPPEDKADIVCTIQYMY